MTSPDQMAEFTGFTEAEVLGLCKKYEMEFAEVQGWYAGALKDYSGEILLVGVNYDKEEKKYECLIESYQKKDI